MICKQNMREELLAHVSAVFEEEVARLAGEPAALEQTARRFGDPAELTAQLQESVPTLDVVQRSLDRAADGACFRPGESTLRRAVRYAIILAAAAGLLLSIPLLLVRTAVGQWPAGVLWQTGLVVLISGYLGFTICIFESSLRRLAGDRTRRSWLRLGLVLAGSTIVSMTLGLLAYGVSPNKVFWVFTFTVGLPAVLARGLAHEFTARKRYHEEWASLQIE
jgi:hypothetical protein